MGQQLSSGGVIRCEGHLGGLSLQQKIHHPRAEVRAMGEPSRASLGPKPCPSRGGSSAAGELAQLSVCVLAKQVTAELVPSRPRVTELVAKDISSGSWMGTSGYLFIC